MILEDGFGALVASLVRACTFVGVVYQPVFSLPSIGSLDWWFGELNPGFL